jgi:hypothetical protein
VDEVFSPDYILSTEDSADSVKESVSVGNGYNSSESENSAEFRIDSMNSFEEKTQGIPI